MVTVSSAQSTPTTTIIACCPSTTAKEEESSSRSRSLALQPHHQFQKQEQKQHMHNDKDQKEVTESMTTNFSSPRLAEVVKSIEQEQWKKVVDLIEEEPILARQNVSMYCQGEQSICTLLHLVCATKCNYQSDYPPIFVLDALISVNPSALTTPDSRGGRLPIHILLLRQSPSPPKVLIQYFMNCSVTQWSIQDDEGNLPLHYAAMYSLSEIFHMILAEFPDACSIANYKSHRTPLHLLCARWTTEKTTIAIDETMTSVSTFNSAVESLPRSLNAESNDNTNDTITHTRKDSHYTDQFTHEDLQHILKVCTRTEPSILSLPDKYGRVPLHLLVDHAYPRWDFVQIFVQEHPAAVLVKDNAKRTPYDLAKFAQRQHHGNKKYHHDKSCHKTTKLELSKLKNHMIHQQYYLRHNQNSNIDTTNLKEELWIDIFLFTLFGHMKQLLKTNKRYKLQKQTNNKLRNGRWWMKKDPDLLSEFRS